MKNLHVIGLFGILSMGLISTSVSAREKSPSSTSTFRQPIIIRPTSPLNNVMNINIYPGIGTNINFEQLSETIETVFLENKSFVGFSTNGSPTNSSLIHLSLIDKLEIPGVVGINNQTKQSSLTIVTKDPAGKRKTYMFNLRQAQSSDRAVALVDFTFPPPPKVDPIALRLDRQKDTSIKSRKILVNKLTAGLKMAIDKGELSDYNDRQFDNVRDMILAVYKGQTLMEAMKQYEVDPVMVARFISLGAV
jgi:hypothetical protein